MNQDDSNDKTYSLSEIEKKLQDAMEAVEILKKPLQLDSLVATLEAISKS